MSDSDDLKLNSISRFSKKSPRLTLEVHSHCEVPAGCGGVVLRWYNPAQGLPVLFTPYFAAAARVFANGIALTSSRPLLPVGPVVIGLEFGQSRPRGALFMLAGERTDSFRESENASTVFRSLSDGSWRYSQSPVPDGWLDPEFDATAWPSLDEQPISSPEKDDYPRLHAYTRLREMGAQPLGLPRNAGSPDPDRVAGLGGLLRRFGSDRQPAGPVWVRKVFDNVPEERAR